MLYNQYRPVKFNDVIGQASAAMLKRQSANGRYAHTYLLCGASGTGKTTTARIIAAAANCLQRGADGEPCGVCQSCKSILNKRLDVDIIEINAAQQRGIDDIVDLNRKAYYTPNYSKYKVYILDEAHRLTLPAWEALLKLLEETPPHLIVILCSTRRDQIPDTIASRCQIFPFNEIPADDIGARLIRLAEAENAKLSQERIKMIAELAAGNMRAAETALEQAISVM